MNKEQDNFSQQDNIFISNNSQKIKMTSSQYDKQFEIANSKFSMFKSEMESENIQLIEVEKQPLINCNCFCVNQPKNRIFDFAQKTMSPLIKMSNRVNNQKYNIITFLPKVIFEQFYYPFNLFQLLVVISQFISIFKVGINHFFILGILIGYIAPLAFVLLLKLFKEANDDYKRYRKDKIANSEQYIVFSKHSKQIVKSGNIHVGDIIEIHANQRIPADMVILKTSEMNGTCFIRTEQLDGETDWKLRRAVRLTQFNQQGKIIDFNQPIDQGQLLVNPPIENIYEFEGLFQLEKKQEPLSLEHTMWANTSLAFGKAIGVVIYTGLDSRSEMNSRLPRTKMGHFDFQISSIGYYLIFLMLIISALLTIFSGYATTLNWYIMLIRFILVLTWIIPISLRVNLDISKMIFSHKINNDKKMTGCLARNSNIPEQLGQIHYLLSDKTGTLTQNYMIFKKLSINEQFFFDFEQQDEIKKILKKNCQKYPEIPLDNSQNKQKVQHRENENILRDLISALVICNNVTPIIENGKNTFSAASPDEIALVQFSKDIGMELISRINSFTLYNQRDENILQFRNADNHLEKYEILLIIPFSSETKRMSTIVRNQSTKQITFYVKGADSVLQSRVRKVYKNFLMDECEQMASDGLRTLVIAQRQLSEYEFLDWFKLYEKAKLSIVNRSKAIRQALDLLEENLEFLGITGVEDKLQDEVLSTIESLRFGGIKIWMLTGDKMETAKCISISTGIKSANQEIFEIRDSEDSLAIYQNLIRYSYKMNTILLIEGGALACLLGSHHKMFFDITQTAPSVIFCRCLPTQKAQIVEGLRLYAKGGVCAVGDGGNDVGMITASDVGVGIYGKEGHQAALAADFSISSFKDLKPLILFHGRKAYKFSAIMAHFICYRGVTISIVQILFCITFQFITLPLYNGILMLGYSSWYTSLPIFCIIFDQDITRSKVLQFPPLYKTLQKGRQMSFKSFLGSTIFLGCIIIFTNSYIDIVTITFSALILSELLNLYTIVHKLTKAMIISQIVTFFSYLITFLFLNQYLNTSSINYHFVKMILQIVFMSWFPVQFLKQILLLIDPSEEQRLMMRV